MTPEQFTSWLSGFTAALGDNPPTDAQFSTIKEKLQTVFHKITPDRSMVQQAPNLFEYLTPVPDCKLVPDGIFEPEFKSSLCLSG